MVANTPDTGEMTKQIEKVDSFMLMEMFMKVNGYRVKHMEGVSMNTVMVRSISVTGKRTDKMGMEWKPGPTIPNMMGPMKMVKNTVSVLSNGQINQFT